MDTSEPEKTTIPRIINKIITMNNANPIALRCENSKNNQDTNNDKLSDWYSLNYFEYIELIHKIGRILIYLDSQLNDGISIYSSNCPEWLIVFLGSIGCGCRPTGIYPTDTLEQITFKITDSNSKIVFVDNEEKASLLLPLIEQKKITKIIVFDYSQRSLNKQEIVYFDKFLELDDLNNQFEIIKRQRSLTPDDICCYIYTSGTTGNPKGVMITHDNLIFEGKIMNSLLSKYNNKKEQRIISYLPLSHIAGMLIDIICPIVGASEGENINVNFARADDLKKGTLIERMKLIKPTLFFGVPRVWEKMKEKIELTLSESNSTKKKIFNWSRNNSSGRNPLSFVSKNILNNLKIKLGLDKCQIFASGAAPLSDEIYEFYKSINIDILESYGMSECTGAICCNLPEFKNQGYVGKILPFCKLKVLKDGQEIEPVDNLGSVSEEQQGELCIQGRNVMPNYWSNPSNPENSKLIDQKNKECLQDGWLHTGDKGSVDKNGFVRVTGRFKDIIIGSGGENISPVPIENKIKNDCSLIEEIIMIGDSKKFNIALLTLNTHDNNEKNTSTIICKEIEEELELSLARKDKRIQDLIYKKICETNNNGNICRNNCYKIQKFCILKEPFSIEGGELTSTLKIKRDYINKKYQDIINNVYSCSQEYYYYE